MTMNDCQKFTIHIKFLWIPAVILMGLYLVNLANMGKYGFVTTTSLGLIISLASTTVLQRKHEVLSHALVCTFLTATISWFISHMNIDRIERLMNTGKSMTDIFRDFFLLMSWDFFVEESWTQHQETFDLLLCLCGIATSILILTTSFCISNRKIGAGKKPYGKISFALATILVTMCVFFATANTFVGLGIIGFSLVTAAFLSFGYLHPRIEQLERKDNEKSHRKADMLTSICLITPVPVATVVFLLVT